MPERDERWTALAAFMHGPEGDAYRSEVAHAVKSLLKRARTDAKVPLGVASTVAGMRRQELWQCENTERPLPVEAALALAAFYKVSLDGPADCKLFWGMEEEDMGDLRPGFGEPAPPAREPAIETGIREESLRYQQVKDQARRYMEAIYGKDVWFKAPETFGNALERWVWAVASSAENTIGEEAMVSIEEWVAAKQQR